MSQISENPSLELIETKVGVIRKTAHATYNDSYCPRERERGEEGEIKSGKNGGTFFDVGGGIFRPLKGAGHILAKGCILTFI